MVKPNINDDPLPDITDDRLQSRAVRGASSYLHLSLLTDPAFAKKLAKEIYINTSLLSRWTE